MPNPRAQRQLTLDRVVSDLKSFAEPAQAMGDMMAGALRGSVAGTAGAAGDISDVARTLAPDTMQTVFGRRVMPTTEEMNKMLPPAVPQDASASRKHTAEMFGALGEFMPAPLSGTLAKGLSYGLGRGAGALTRGAGKAVNDAMVYNTGPLAQGSLSFLAPKAATMHVVKPEGGNWLGGNMSGSTVGNVDKSLNRYKTETVAGKTPAERIPMHEQLLKDPSLNDEGRATVQRHLDVTKGEAAVDKWIENNIGNYVKKQMATPSDPVRLMLEKRSQEIEAQFQVDMNRAERTRARAEAEPDPRRQANLMRQAAQQEEQAKFDRDFATQNASHLSPEQQPWGDIDSQAVTELRGKRKQAGFSPEGEAKSDLAKRWEELSDEAVGINRAGDVQAQKDAMTKAQNAERAFLTKDDEVNETFRPRLIETLAQRGESLSDKDLDALVKNLPTSQKAVIIGEGDTWNALRNESQQARINVNSGLWGAYSENKWIDKLNPETNVYSAYIGDLGFDHVIDVIRQDVAAGRIRPEQLNKLSMDQAIQRTADFNAEQAKKMQETAIKNTEGMPIHKEYPEEGYKWIELAEPKMPESWKLPEGYILKKDERAQNEKSPWFVYGPNGEVVSGKKGLFHATPEQAIENVYSKDAYKTLEDALKYEGDTMGHCVGGYCPDVVEGKSRIYSLRDKRGEPHVTVEVKPDSYYPYGPPHANILENMEVAKEQAIAQGLPTDYDTLYSISTDLLKKNTSPSIVQIKGKQNQAPKEQYLPYVQDFVRSGQYSDVGDLRNTGLMDVKYMTNPETYKLYLERGLSVPKYATEKELEQLHNEYLRLAEPHNYKPPEDGMKKGGKVSISDNCDCHQMAVMDQHMAGGGALSKAAIEALERMKALKPEFQARVNLQNKYKAETVGLPYNEVKPLQMTNEQIREEMDRMAREQAEREQSKGKGGAVKSLAKAVVENEKALPPVLPRAKPKTKEDIRPYAQEMAEAMSGNFVRPNPAKSMNPANKSFSQWKMEQTLGHDIRPKKGVQLKQQEIADIEKQLGQLKVGISGDTSISDKMLHRAGDYVLKKPSEQQGGPLFGLKGAPWASNIVPLKNLQTGVNELSKAHGDAPVLGQFMQMGPEGTNFAQHFADANLSAIDLTKMSPSQIESFNNLIAKGNTKSGKHPTFPGIQDPNGAYFYFTMYPELRKHFNSLMTQPTYTAEHNLPDGRVILHAITEPELRDLPVATTGFAQYPLVAGHDPLQLPFSKGHGTYSHDLPEITGAIPTRAKYPTPAEIDFPDVTDYAINVKKYRPQDMTRVFQTATPRQMIDPQHVDEIKMYEELMKQYTGKKEGGEVKMDKGGKTSLKSKALGASLPLALTAGSDDPMDWGTMFAGMKSTIPLSMALYSGATNENEKEELDKRFGPASFYVKPAGQGPVKKNSLEREVPRNKLDDWALMQRVKEQYPNILSMPKDQQIKAFENTIGMDVFKTDSNSSFARGGAITGDDLILEERPL